MRSAVSSDLDAIVALVAGTRGGKSVLTDVNRYLTGRRDPLTEVRRDGREGGEKKLGMGFVT